MKKRIFNPLTGEFDYVGEITGDYVVNYAGDYVVKYDGDYVVKYDGDYVAMKYDGDYIEQCVGIKINLIDNATTPWNHLSMEPDNRYRFTSPIGSMVLSLQSAPVVDRAYSYELDFVAGDDFSISIPNAVRWVKTPVFNPGKRYLVSMEMSLVGSESEIIGMYIEMEA